MCCKLIIGETGVLSESALDEIQFCNQRQRCIIQSGAVVLLMCVPLMMKIEARADSASNLSFIQDVGDNSATLHEGHRGIFNLTNASRPGPSVLRPHVDASPTPGWQFIAWQRFESKLDNPEVNAPTDWLMNFNSGVQAWGSTFYFIGVRKAGSSRIFVTTLPKLKLMEEW